MEHWNRRAAKCWMHNLLHSVFAPIKLDTLESPASAHTHRVSSDHGDGIFSTTDNLPLFEAIPEFCTPLVTSNWLCSDL